MAPCFTRVFNALYVQSFGVIRLALPGCAADTTLTSSVLIPSTTGRALGIAKSSAWATPKDATKQRVPILRTRRIIDKRRVYCVFIKVSLN